MTVPRTLLAAAVATAAGLTLLVAQPLVSPGAKMTAAAEKFLTTLTPELKQKAAFPYDSPQRLTWHFVPLQDKDRRPTRKGVRFEEMTDAQRDFLKDKLTQFEGLHNDLVNVVARNGTIQNRIDSATQDLKNRADTLEEMVGDVASVDMAEAISRLQLAQFSVQAAAEVFSTLRDSSLLNFLR